MKRIIAVIVAVAFGLPAWGQVPKSTIASDITTAFPDNATGVITPATTRNFLNALSLSYQQYAGVNAQVGTSYTININDYGQFITFNNSSAIAVALPQANGSFSTFNTYVRNLGAGVVTITPSGSTINGAASLALAQNQFTWIVSDGTNYQVLTTGIIPITCSSLPALTGDVTTSAGSCGTAVSKIDGTSVSGTTGSGNVVFGTSPSLITPSLGAATGSSLLFSGATPPSLSAGNGSAYASATAGGVFSGQGSSYDVSLLNKSGAAALEVPTGTTNVNIIGTLAFGTLSPTSLAQSPTTITGLTTNNSPSGSSDYFLYYSASAGTIEKCTVAACSSAATAGVSSLNGLTGGLSLGAGNGAAVSSGGSTITISSYIPSPQGRLTLVTGTPVMTANETAKSEIFYDCYNGGSQVPIYNGTNDLIFTIGSCEITDTMPTTGTGVTNNAGVFDEWLISVSGTLTLCHATNGSGGGWASDSGGSNVARGTGYSQLDKTSRPYITNKNSITDCYNGSTDEGPISGNQGTYSGSFYTTSAGQTGMNFSPAAASDGSNPVLGLYNAYNRVRVSSTDQDSTATWTYATATWRFANGQSTNRIRYVDGLAQSNVIGTYEISGSGVAGGAAVVGLERDWSSGAPTGVVGVISPGSGTITTDTNGVTHNGWVPALGLHEIDALEFGGSAVTFFGTGLGGGQNMGLYINLDM